MSSERKYCISCGERLLGLNAKFCFKCGKALDSIQNNETSQDISNNKKFSINNETSQDTSNNKKFSTESPLSNNSSNNKGSTLIIDIIKVIVFLGIIFVVATVGLGLNLGGTEQPQSIAQSPILQAISPTEVFIQSIEVIKNDIHIKVKIGGDYHHWNIDIKRLSESGSAGGIIVGKTFLSHILSDLKPGTYTICVGAADSENRLLGPQDCKGGIVIAPTEISIVSIDISGNDLMIDIYINGAYDHWRVGVADNEKRHMNQLSKSGSIGGIIVDKGSMYRLADLNPGTYTICVGVADSENRLLGPLDCRSEIVIELFDLEWKIFSSDLDVGFPNAWYKITLAVFNPNLIPVTISEGDVGLYVNGEFIGNSEFAGGGEGIKTISVNGKTLITIEIEISYAKLIQLGIEGSGTIRLDGSTRLFSLDMSQTKSQVFTLSERYG